MTWWLMSFLNAPSVLDNTKHICEVAKEPPGDKKDLDAGLFPAEFQQY